MNDPFRNLREKREAQESTKHHKREEEQKAQQREEQLALERGSIGKSFDQLVREVLEQLRDAAYPHCWVSDIDLRGQPSWHLEFQSPAEIGIGHSTHYAVVVTLQFANNTPMYFSCRREGSDKEFRGNLSREGLIEALRQLHA